MWNQIFDGYCPECKLNGEDVPMRLNAHDFFESEKEIIYHIYLKNN